MAKRKTIQEENPDNAGVNATEYTVLQKVSGLAPVERNPQYCV